MSYNEACTEICANYVFLTFNNTKNRSYLLMRNIFQDDSQHSKNLLMIQS